MQTVLHSIRNLSLLCYLCVTLNLHSQNKHHTTWDYDDSSFLSQKFNIV